MNRTYKQILSHRLAGPQYKKPPTLWATITKRIKAD